MDGPPGTPPRATPGQTATAEQLTEQMQYLTARFSSIENALAESERLRRVQAEEIRTLRAQASASAGSANVGIPTAASSGSGPQPPLAPRAPVIDTRVIGKPKAFKGSPQEWPNWNVVFKCYCGALSPQLAALMEWAASHPGECLNAALTQDQVHCSTELYYILIMLVEGAALTRVINAGHGQGLNAWRMLVLEYEPKSSARHVGDLLHILQYDFGTNIIVGFETFDRLVAEYNRRTPGDPLQDQVLVGTVLRNLAEGPLKQHLLLSLDQLDSYVKLRNEVVRVRHAQIAASGSPQPMDVGEVHGDLDALGKGAGRGRGRGKGGGKGGRGGGSASPTVNCHYCGKAGHYSRDCRKRIADQGGGGAGAGNAGGGKPYPKAKAKGKASPKPKAQPFKGKCNNCGKVGHMAKDCRSKKQISAVEPAAAGPEEEPEHDFGGFFFNALDAESADVLACECCCPPSNRELTQQADSNLMKATAALAALEAEVVTFAVDSGAAVTVIDPKTAKDYPLLENAESRAGKTYRSAFGGQTPDMGTRALIGTVGSSSTVRGLKARVAKVVRPLASVFEMVESGHRVVFDSEGSFAEHKASGVRTAFRARNRSYEMDLNVVPYGKLAKRLQVKTVDLAPLTKSDSDTCSPGGRRQRPPRV